MIATSCRAVRDRRRNFSMSIVMHCINHYWHSLVKILSLQSIYKKLLNTTVFPHFPLLISTATHKGDKQTHFCTVQLAFTKSGKQKPIWLACFLHNHDKHECTVSLIWNGYTLLLTNRIGYYAKGTNRRDLQRIRIIKKNYSMDLNNVNRSAPRD